MLCSSDEPKKSEKFSILNKFIEETLLPGMMSGHSYKVSEIASSLTKLSYNEETIFHTNEIERYVTKYFSNLIKVYKNPQCKERDYIFSNNLSIHICHKI